MATITGTNGAAGHNGTATVSPTAGGDGQDESFTLNGNITSIFDPVIVTGGNGGKGGNGAAGHPGATGGAGGDADISLGGNIIMPASGSFNMTGTATGGKGGAGGTGTPGGDGGPGGSASVLFNGNIVQASNNLSTITVEAVATAGAGGAGAAGGNKGSAGNADAELNGDIVQYSGSSAANATVAAIANGATGDSTAFEGDPTWGSKTATLNGNIVQGNLNNVTMQADAKFSNSSATITGNIIQTNATNTGTVTLEATGEHIDIEKNKVTLGKQAFAFTLNELGPDYDTTVKGNTFTGSGTNTFIFTDNATPGPSPDVVSIDLTAKQFVFNGDNNALKGFANITVNGTAGMILTGDSGNNIIIGGAGNDTIIATAGTDTYDGGGGVNTLDYSENATGPNGVTVNLSLTTAQAVGGGFGPDTILHIQNLIGTDFNDTLTGSSDNNVIDALGGDDTVFATAGNDTYDGGSGTNTLDYSLAPGVGAVGVTVDLSNTGPQNVGGGFGTDTISNFQNLNGSAKNDKLTGTSGDNVILAGAGNDTVFATAGTDTYDGGTGTNTLDYSATVIGPGGVTVNLSLTTAQAVGGGFGPDTISNFQNLTGTDSNDTLTGSSANNIIDALDGDDTVFATAGDDTYDGGAGTNTLDYSLAPGVGAVGVTVNLSLTTAQAVGGGFGNDTISNFQNLNGSSHNDTLTGTSGDNVILAGAGDDTVFATAGNDTYDGGSGTNTLDYSLAPGVGAVGVTVDLSNTGPQNVGGGFGTDTISNFQNLNGSAKNDTLTGTSGDNVIQAGAGNDTIYATAGTDTYDGGAGVNTLDYSAIAIGPGGVTVNLSLTTAQAVGGGFGPDTILHIQNLTGTGFDDTLTGSTANNIIDAGDGDDTVFATAGTDTYDGGAGTDTLDYSLAPGVGAVGVTVNLSLTTAQAVGGGFGPDTISNFENLNGSAKNDTLTGTSGDNVIQAGAGNDTIIATNGTDTYDGGTGTDTLDYSNATAGVTVNLTTGTATGWGTDTILGIEKLIGSSHNDVLTGLATNDTIQAGAGNDTIDATKGTDAYDGGTGTNTLTYAGATVGVTVDLSLTGPQTVAAGYTDTITNIQKLTGSAHNDFLMGSGLGGNTLMGGAGNDILYSRGGGTNIVNGGGGTDVAYYDGLETGYSTHTLTNVVGGPDGANDTLTAGTVERLKFLAPSHVADVNNNGTGDFILQGTTGPAAIFGAGPSIPVALTASQKIIGTGQFNPDVDRDAGLLIQDSTSHQISVIADPTVSTALVPVFNPGANWNAVTAGDFNGDASSDILIQNSVTGQAKILFLKENSTDAVGTVNGAAVIITPPNGSGWKAIAAGDFNGDGKSDILWQQGGAGGPVEVTLMNGSTILNPGTTPISAPGLTALATGDFDGDGKSDIVFSTGGAGAPAVIWTMNGDSMTGGPFTVAAPTLGISGPGAFTLKGAEDVNGDGVSDLLWQQIVDGDVDATVMTNPSTYTQFSLFSTLTPAVHLLASTGGG